MPMEVHTQPTQTNTPTTGNIPSYEILWNKAISSSKPNLADCKFLSIDKYILNIFIKIKININFFKIFFF